jgi:hypothetical protein
MEIITLKWLQMLRQDHHTICWPQQGKFTSSCHNLVSILTTQAAYF